jgi:hypothetical protein
MKSTYPGIFIVDLQYLHITFAFCPSSSGNTFRCTQACNKKDKQIQHEQLKLTLDVME